jgi:hypothetical protein
MRTLNPKAQEILERFNTATDTELALVADYFRTAQALDTPARREGHSLAWKVAWNSCWNCDWTNAYDVRNAERADANPDAWACALDAIVAATLLSPDSISADTYFELVGPWASVFGEAAA